MPMLRVPLGAVDRIPFDAQFVTHPVCNHKLGLDLSVWHVIILALLCPPSPQVVMAYTVGIAAALSAFQYCPADLPWLQWANVFMIGFFLYGPQMLIGLCGAELVGPDSVGASEGFLGAWVIIS